MAEVPLEVDAESTAARLVGKAETGLRLIDCREADEWQICHIDGAELVPLSNFAELAPRKLGDPEAPIIVYCHHGVRSLHATQWLRRAGYAQAQSLMGGIDRWADLVDPEMSRY